MGTRRLLRTLLAGAIGVAAIVLVLLWLLGIFHAKVPVAAPTDVLRDAPALPTHTVAATTSTVIESAVGTIEAVERIAVGSRLLARVEKVHVRPSQAVQKGEVLVELDDRHLKAEVAEAEAALDSAAATRKQAELDLGRSRELFQRGMVAEDRIDKDETTLRRASADVERFTEVVRRAKAGLEYATVRAPTAGVVIEKLVEPGNLATPGQELVTLYDPERLQLVASVRETLAARLQPGSKVRVRIDSLDLDCEAEIARIVPEAMRQSRAFRVEVTGPCPPGVLSGMFGRLLLPVGERREILVPASCLRRAGQLDLVFVVRADGKLLRRFVRVGREEPDRVEILSGLREGEKVLLDADAAGEG